MKTTEFHAKITRIQEGEVENPDEITWVFRIKAKVGDSERIVRALRELIPEDEREEFLAEFKRAGAAAGLKV